MSNNVIIYHNYLGSDRVINDLKKFDSYSDGYVNLTKSMYQRDDYINQVNLISQR